MYKVEFYSRKPLLKRRQHYWRVKSPNGNIVSDSSEGYNNKTDCRNAWVRFCAAIKRDDFEISPKA